LEPRLFGCGGERIAGCSLQTARIGVEEDHVGAATKNCTELTRLASEQCADVLRLRAELATARSADKLRDELTGLLNREAGGHLEADPESSFFHRLTGFGVLEIQTVLGVLLQAWSSN